MANKNIAVAKLQLRRDTAANWATKNPVLAVAEEGYETDTGKRKVGDGVKTWNNLPYDGGGGGGVIWRRW